MQQYMVDFREAKSIWDIHAALKNGLFFPDSYGMNADALWDYLTSNINDPCVIYLKGMNKIPKALHNEVQVLSRIFDRAEIWYNNIDSQVSFLMVD
jgi:RNAse (barnase) inhibitor barstar